MSTTKKHTMLPNPTPIPTKKKYVVAGTFAEYKNYIERKGLDRREHVYVSDISTIKGLSSISGVYIGTWRDRDDIGEIQLQIRLVKEHEKMLDNAAEQIAKRINGGLIAQTMADIPDPRILNKMTDTQNAIELLMNSMWLENTKKENT